MSYNHLTRDDRVQLGMCLRLGLSQAKAAKQIHKHPGTVSRELQRNGHPTSSGYHAAVADRRARLRRVAANARPRITPDSFLARYIPAALRCEYSPEQIAGKLRFVLGGSQICHETIYQWVYFKRPELKTDLPSRKGKYRRKRGTNARWLKRELAKKKWIDERPAIVETRSRLGDWEGDTVHGATHSGYIATLVERKSGYLVASKLENPNGRNAGCGHRLTGGSRREAADVDPGQWLRDGRTRRNGTPNRHAGLLCPAISLVGAGDERKYERPAQAIFS